MQRNKNQKGFTLIELLVVVAIIALLSSIALIALIQARQKSRDTKRLGDMTQMNTALELYYAYYKGYPDVVAGAPAGGISPQFLSTIPRAPIPGDGVCDGLLHSAACSAEDPACANVLANTYYYIPSGTSYVINGTTVYPDYMYFFCLGQKTGNFSPGERILTPRGVK